MKRAETGSPVGSGCAHGVSEHKFISKESKDLCCYSRLPNTHTAGKHTYLGHISGFWEISNEVLMIKSREILDVPLSIKTSTFIIKKYRM